MMKVFKIFTKQISYFEMPTTFKQQRNKGNCSIVELKGKHFLTKGVPSIYIDKAWEESVKRLDELARLCKVKISVLKSFELHTNERSMFDFAEKLNPNHFVGQALSVHVYDLQGNLLSNETCLKSNSLLCIRFVVIIKGDAF